MPLDKSSLLRPRILVTTSHRPTRRVRSFVNELTSILPYAIRVNRGKSSLQDLLYDAMAIGVQRVVVVSVWKGNPGSITVFEPVEAPEAMLKAVALIRLKSATLRREIPGSVKRLLTRRAGIDVTELSPSLQYLADVFSNAFLYNIVFGEEEYKDYDVIAKASSSEDFIIINFYCYNAKEKVCGPRLKIVRVDDYVSGFRFHRNKAWIEKTSF